MNKKNNNVNNNEILKPVYGTPIRRHHIFEQNIPIYMASLSWKNKMDALIDFFFRRKPLCTMDTVPGVYIHQTAQLQYSFPNHTYMHTYTDSWKRIVDIYCYL